MGASSSTGQGSDGAQFGGSRTRQRITDNLVLEVDEQSGEIRLVSRLLEPSAEEVQAGRGGGGEGRRVVEEGGRESEEGREGRLPVIDEGCEGGMEGDEEQEGAGERGEAREEDSEDTDSDVDSDITSSRLSTLRLLARLFGGRSAAPRSCNAAAKEEVYPAPTPMSPSCDLYHQIHRSGDRVLAVGRGGGGGLRGRGRNMCQKLSARQFCLNGLSRDQEVSLTQHMLPQHPCLVDVYTSRAFCGTHNNDGSVFLCAVQDNRIYLYNTTGPTYQEYKTVLGREVGWSILDVVFSPDQYWFAYSTWSPSVHVCNVYGEEEKHYSLDMRPDMEDRFCAFSVQFSNDSTEIVASASDGYLYVYNRDICDRTLKIDAHHDDANAVTFADQSSQIIFSGGDDGLCMVWDRRALSEASPKPVGCLAGHKDGITFIDTKGDGRYLITNSKDQTIKLWDIRQFSSQKAMEATLSRVQCQSWDYRWQNVPKRARREAMEKLPGDSSVMTYAGHMVKHTLLRCRFSPSATTGQKYIYTACAKGRVIVYDVLTGEVVKALTSENCRNCIRDVSWHPTQPGELVATSWDGVLQMWTYNKRENMVPDSGRRSYFDFW